MKRHLFRVLLALLALPTVAFANSGAPPAFDALNNSMMNMATGPLGTMLAMTMLVMGMGIAVAKNSPMPAISAMMGAGFLHWGPAFIMTIMGGAQSYPAYSSEKTVQVFAAKPQPASTALSASTSKARPPWWLHRPRP